MAKIKTCHPHNIHLTFDDGPSLIATEKILAGLKKRGTKATFFISTTNIDNNSELGALVLKELKEGHTVGDHGYEHNAYDLRMINGKVESNGYSENEANQQIKKSINLLDHVTNMRFSNQENMFFRFPYGRGAMPSADELNYMEKHGEVVFESKNYSERLIEYRKQSKAVASISDNGFSHLGWNHDSEDFKYGVQNESSSDIGNFVSENISRLCNSKLNTQVALFHDIKAINIKAIPLIIDIGKCLGLNFVSANEMMRASVDLVEKGVLIPKEYQLKGATENVSKIARVAKSITCKTCQIITPPSHKTCSSSNGKTYLHCEGEDSICYNGEWISRATAILEEKCHLN